MESQIARDVPGAQGPQETENEPNGFTDHRQ